MELWECIYYMGDCGHGPFCQDGQNLCQCSDKCPAHMPLWKWRKRFMKGEDDVKEDI